jgi:hypothetical protein
MAFFSMRRSWHSLGILNEGDFFGEGALAGQTLRMGFAVAITFAFFARPGFSGRDQ